MIQKKTQYTELDHDLGCFTAQVIEDQMKKILPDTQMRLFGSTQMGFGQTGGDLDLTLTFDGTTALVHVQKSLRRIRIIVYAVFV